MTQFIQPEYSKKKSIGSLVGLIIGFGVIGFVTYWFNRPPSFEKLMLGAATEVNKKCPLMADSQTRLDSVSVLLPKTFQYNYTIISVEKSDVNIPVLENELEPILIDQVKNNADLKVFKDHKGTIVYNYRDTLGATISKFIITPEKYQ